MLLPDETTKIVVSSAGNRTTDTPKALIPILDYMNGKSANSNFTKAIDDGVYATKLLEHSYTLKMFAKCDEQTSSESYNKEEVIDDITVILIFFEE